MLQSWPQHFNTGHPQQSRHTTAQSKSDRKGRRGGTLGLHPKAPRFASERGFAPRGQAASFPLLCNNKNSTCLEPSGSQRLAQPAGPEGLPLNQQGAARWSFPQDHSPWESHTGLPFSADGQKRPGSTLQHPPHSVTAPRGQRLSICMRSEGRKTHISTEMQPVAPSFRAKRLETAGEGPGTGPRIRRLKSYAAIESDEPAEAGNPPDGQSC